MVELFFLLLPRWFHAWNADLVLLSGLGSLLLQDSAATITDLSAGWGLPPLSEWVQKVAINSAGKNIWSHGQHILTLHSALRGRSGDDDAGEAPISHLKIYVIHAINHNLAWQHKRSLELLVKRCVDPDVGIICYNLTKVKKKKTFQILLRKITNSIAAPQH